MTRFLTIVTLCLSSIVFSQNDATQSASVEKSVFGIQVGAFGTWLYNEYKLADKIALRTEIGLQTFTFQKNESDDIKYFLTPEVTLEPRFYYNLNKRSSQGKDISGNSGNYFSLRSSYYGDFFTLGYSDLDFVPELNIVPTWGMKRNIGSNFNYEFGGGLGYRKVFEDNERINRNNQDIAIYIHARIGYKF